MTLYSFILIGSYSIAVACVIAACRIRRIHPVYYPFVAIIFTALIVEVVSHALIRSGRENAVVINLLGVAEAMLWLWQFEKWDVFYRRRWLKVSIVLLLSATWFVENILFKLLGSFSSAYAILYAAIMVSLSIRVLQGIIVVEQGFLLKKSRFLICCGTTIFYTYKILVECFYLLEPDKHSDFLSRVFFILAAVNFFVNILFAVATLWIPTRIKFLFPY